MGLLKPGEQLPTVRDLSLELTINPNTVVRAYRELEYMGIIKSAQGRGTFVAENVPHMEQREKRLLLEKMLEEAVCEAVQLGVDPSVLEDILAGVVKRLKRGDGENEL